MMAYNSMPNYSRIKSNTYSINTNSSNVLRHSVGDLCGNKPRTQENWDWTPKKEKTNGKTDQKIKNVI